MLKETYDLVIVGQGPAGLTAGIYAVRAGLDAVAIERGAAGGQVLLTEIVENYPGFPDGIKGGALSQLLAEHARRQEVPMEYGALSGIEARGVGDLVLTTDSGAVRAKAAIIATGAAPKQLGIPGEAELYGRGVSYCAVCDGNFFRGKDVCVIGGGDSAVEEATYLSRICARVIVVHRRGELRAVKAAQDAAFRQKNIEFLWHHVPLAVHGKDEVESLRVRDVRTDEERDVPCAGVFFYVGLNPSMDFLGDAFRRTQAGFLWTDAELMTSVTGVFGAGDVRRERNRQITTAVSDGTEAALNAERFLTEKGLK